VNKLLIISGPTATGKTKLALHLAKLFDGELISADSRQVYKGMDIGTGKEFSLNIPIWGYDLVFPNEEWSAAHFVKMARTEITNIWQRKKLPIVVGGTGLYIKNLLHPPTTLFISPDKKLRRQLEQLNMPQLQNKLRRMSPRRFSDMNESDQKNPRRLIRAIEVVKFAKLHQPSEGFANFRPAALHIGLTSSIKEIDRRIKNRIANRLKQGLKQEVKTLVKKYGWDSVLSTTIAYQEWYPYFENKVQLEKVIETWTIHEKQYARRQLTWFKKQPNIHWFDVTASDFPNNIVSLVKQWYYQQYAPRPKIYH